MNAHIPDQLDQLSKKELLEVAQIMHETNVDLNAQLAKANERVKELESHIEECDEYLDINRYTAIGNMSILHRQMKQLRKEQEQ